MARKVDPTAHAVRRDVFLDAAQRLIQTKGYEDLSIQDVLDDVDASKGAFYHYFDSKAALLEGVVAQMVAAAMASLAPGLEDPNRTALQKLEGFIGGLARWKNQRRELLIALIRVWLSDENAIVREKFRRGVARTLTPVMASIIRQGLAEGSFSTESADDTARVFVSLLMGANETAVDLFLARQADAVTLEQVERQFDAYALAFSRVLGARAGSVILADPSTIHLWFGAPSERKEAQL